MFIHTVSNDVDFESIRTPDDNSSTTLLLEYLSLPESSYTNNGQLSAQKYSHVDGHANYAERTCTDSHQCIHLQLQLPMHIRYQPVFSDCKTMVPLSESADSTHLHRMRLPVPAISLRPANVSHNSQAFAAINAGQNKSTHWLYNKTRLGNIGNNEFYSILYNKVPEYVAAVTNKNNDAVVFSYPGGCRDELSSVVCSNIVMVMCTTAIIVVLLFCKV